MAFDTSVMRPLFTFHNTHNNIKQNERVVIKMGLIFWNVFKILPIIFWRATLLFISMSSNEVGGVSYTRFFYILPQKKYTANPEIVGQFCWLPPPFHLLRNYLRNFVHHIESVLVHYLVVATFSLLYLVAHYVTVIKIYNHFVHSNLIKKSENLIRVPRILPQMLTDHLYW